MRIFGILVAAMLPVTAVAQTTVNDGVMPGGPFYLHGRDIVVCTAPNERIVEALSAPNAEERIGRHNFMELFEEAGCADAPSGVPVNVRAAGKRIAMILPYKGAGVPAFVLREHVVDRGGNPIGPFEPTPRTLSR